MKTRPYLVRVVDVDAEALATGRRRCATPSTSTPSASAADMWPGYGDGIELISLPAWATYDIDLEV